MAGRKDMATAAVCEFLESSTIHGLAHISTAKSKAARAAWVVIVVSSFAFAISMITNAYLEWHESPVSTTITTHPITELEFPAVTVCPPRGSNTAVNHLLEKVKYVNFTKEDRQQLLNISKEVFLETPNKKHARQLGELFSFENMKSIVNEQARMPEIDQNGMITIRSSELEASFETPGFADPEYNGDFYSRPQSLHYVLDLPDNIGEIVGDGVLVVSVETEGNWRFISPGNRLKVHGAKTTWLLAEDLCASKDSHLASVGSHRENEEIKKLVSRIRGGKALAGRRKEEGEGWEWLDGRPWDYQSWKSGHPINKKHTKCLWFNNDGTWSSQACNTIWSISAICANLPTNKSGNHTFTYKKDSLINPSFHFWWNHTQDSMGSGTQGFKLSWHIENGSLPDVKQFVSRYLSGSVSTPRFDTVAPANYYKERHDYTAVIELPHNITDVIGSGALVVDVDVTVPEVQPEAEVELLTAQMQLVYYETRLTWPLAEAHCVSLGGHLASFTSPDDWNRLQSLISNKKAQKRQVWLGFNDLEKEGEWISTDGRKWPTKHRKWAPSKIFGHRNKNCICTQEGVLIDLQCRGKKFNFICSEPTRRSIKVDSQLVFTSKNISAPVLEFKWNTKPINQAIRKKAVGGFKIEWQVNGHKAGEKSNNQNETFWVQNENQVSSNKDPNLRTVLNLVRESKVNKVSEEDVWRSLLKHRWSKEILSHSTCLDEGQEHKVIVKAAQELNLVSGYNAWVPNEDVVFGFKLYSSVHYCPSTPADAAKLSHFFANLLTNHSLNTVVSATMQNIQPKAGSILDDFSAMNAWYTLLERKYNFFSLGHIMTTVSSEEQLKRLSKLNPPYVKETSATEGFKLNGRL